MKPASHSVRLFVVGAVLALTGLVAAQSASQAPTAASPADVHVKAAKQAQQKRDYSGAVAEYRLAVEADPDNADAHAGFISATQSLAYMNAGLDKAQTTAERRTALYGGRAAADKALGGFYTSLEARYPKCAAVQWALGRVHGDQPAAAEAYYRTALALDSRFARAYLDIGRLAQQADDRPKTREFYRKASEADPGNDNTAYLYATALKPIDRLQYVSAVDDLIRRFPKSSWSARALADSAEGAAPADRVQRLERMQREFPDIFKDGYGTRLFGAYVSAGSADRAVEFAGAQLAAAATGRPQDQWRGRVAYGEAIVEARRLHEAGRHDEAQAVVDRTLASQTLDLQDRERLHLIWAEAAVSSKNVRAAIDRLMDACAVFPTRELRLQIDALRSPANMSPGDIDNSIWDRRTKAAKAMADFTLSRLDTGANIHLADLRGKVVLVNFWFPG